MRFLLLSIVGDVTVGLFDMFYTPEDKIINSVQGARFHNQLQELHKEMAAKHTQKVREALRSWDHQDLADFAYEMYVRQNSLNGLIGEHKMKSAHYVNDNFKHDLRLKADAEDSMELLQAIRVEIQNEFGERASELARSMKVASQDD